MFMAAPTSLAVSTSIAIRCNDMRASSRLECWRPSIDSRPNFLSHAVYMTVRTSINTSEHMLTTLGLAAYLYLLEEKHDPTTIILAGDSAGGGMVLSMLVTLRDQGIPLPAGAILISPWVDLTHSFPSLGGDDKMDYIPSHGFIHKPSMSWRKLVLFSLLSYY